MVQSSKSKRDLGIRRPTVYDFRDYRIFLKEMFAFSKHENPKFSYRLFCKKSGFASPNFLQRVIDGKRNLTTNSIPKIARGFELNKQEREFFENLVLMNQSPDHTEKEHYFRKMMSFAGFLKIHKIEKAQYEYLSKWYYPAIREIVILGNGKHKAKQIASMLHPSITLKAAQKDLKILVDLAMIRKNSKGRWEQCDSVLSTGPEIRSLAAVKFHNQMLNLAKESIARYEPKERDIGSLTLSVNKKSAAELKIRIIAFRKELLRLASESEDPDRVLQINTQMFPLATLGK